MQIFDSQQSLSEIIADLWLRQSSSSLVELHERSASAKFQQDINVVGVLKETMETNYMRMTQRAMNLNLHCHLQVHVRL